jgi:hypothetical protein
MHQYNVGVQVKCEVKNLQHFEIINHAQKPVSQFIKIKNGFVLGTCDYLK